MACIENKIISKHIHAITPYVVVALTDTYKEVDGIKEDFF